MANKRDNVRTSRRSMRVKRKIKQTKPVDVLRVSIFKSLNHIYAQIIDDIAQQTVVSFSTMQLTKTNKDKNTQAESVGTELAKLAKDKGIKRVVFDRGQFLYHGRVKALAEGLRQGGIDF